ncbi:Probable replication-associated protein RepA1 (plasmid) [Buchnera aphidicola (Anoecia corni)]|uniref:Probable replication-associated protein RepA1 n=1 Tax=Buchnera aphidicola (Anoecia corni) TaxID=2994477 RepID=A0AAT9J470_9GAMM
MKLKRKIYVSNSVPYFYPPKNDKARPSFIQYAINKAKNIDFSRTGLDYFIVATRNFSEKNRFIRKRKLNSHRALAMRVIVQAMLYHYNMLSKLVQASIEQLSDECRLSTISSAGNKSITRASRLITDFMEPIGLIKCEKKWDRVLGHYMPKLITLTPLFFLILDIKMERLENARYQRLGWINKGLIEKGSKPITLDEACQRCKDQQIRNMIKYRLDQHNLKLKVNRAKKLVSLNEVEAKQKILRNLISRYSVIELTVMGFSGLKKQVNIEYFFLKKLFFNDQ